jgi:hypothetical protein
MSSPSDKSRAAWRALAVPLHAGTVLLALLAVPIIALAGVSTVQSVDAPRSGAYARDAKPNASYQMRCWQYGRLLFEEPLYALPAEGTRYTLKVSGTDRYGKPVYVAETSNATCLIRSSYEARTLPR